MTALPTEAPSDVRHPGPLSDAAGSAIRVGLFCFTLLFSWIGLTAFVDLSDSRLLEADSGGNLVHQLIYVLLGPLIVLTAMKIQPGLVKSFTRTWLWPLLGWIVFTIVLGGLVFGGEVDLPLRRFVLAAIVIGISIGLLALPRDVRQLGFMLAAVSIIVLALSFFGIAAFPDLTIHQKTDVLDAELHGDWRGVFTHKNIAAAMMVITVFAGIFISRVATPILGIPIAAFAFLFLLGTHGKTSTAMLPVCLVIAFAVARARSPIARCLLVGVPLALLNLGTVGAATIPGMLQQVRQVLPGTTFTGRTEIWQFSISKISERPILGYGFGGFWRTSHTMHAQHNEVPGETDTDASVTLAQHAHNAYVNLALTIGIPGLALTIIWLVFQVAVDAGARPEDPYGLALRDLFLQIWVFGLGLGGLESIIFDRSNPIWLLMVFSAVGISWLRMSQPIGNSAARQLPQAIDDDRVFTIEQSSDASAGAIWSSPWRAATRKRAA